MPLHGNNFQLAKPTIVLNADSAELGTVLRPLGEFIAQYVKEPEVTKPCTVVITANMAHVVHYTWGPQYPTHKVDNISCFKYTGPITVTNNVHQDGTVLYVASFVKDADGNAEPNNQSPVVIAKFKVDKEVV